ncbi:hypothetical protein A0O28_0080120 [Trichoderma guizhouense]|uniref:Uncharacterized protein n=1 Tax=Trichoderma guizhouense TaxID=1491466 RepID=A0A1T3CJM6_9HYPO|nr:hypothetical protein A0O28_0080120 [Trichoderma guizhouense]
MHLNAKTILQIHGRLNRLGQKNTVKWHNLKIKNSFHGHEEIVLLTNWPRELSTEACLPYWITGALREVVLFELMKAYMNHPFNRYAWIVTYDRDGPKMECYTQTLVKMGHAYSALAKLVMKTDREQFWTENDEYLMVSMFEMSQEISVEEFKTWFTCGEQLLRQKMQEKLERHIMVVKSNQSKKQQAKALKDQVKTRKNKYKSDEFINPEDMEGEIEDEDEGEVSTDEEFGLPGDEE